MLGMITSLEVAQLLIFSTLASCHKLKLEKTVSYGGHKKGMKLSVIIVSAVKDDCIKVIKNLGP
jgi:serine protease inhibitor ecotin